MEGVEMDEDVVHADPFDEVHHLLCGVEEMVFIAVDRLDTEPDAGGIPLWYEGAYPTTPLEWWELAKQQRGAWDPSTGALASPAFSAARSHYRIAMSPRSPHGHAYGGYLPTPYLAGEPCEDPDTEDDRPAPPNLVHDISISHLA